MVHLLCEVIYQFNKTVYSYYAVSDVNKANKLVCISLPYVNSGTEYCTVVSVLSTMRVLYCTLCARAATGSVVHPAAGALQCGPVGSIVVYCGRPTVRARFAFIKFALLLLCRCRRIWSVHAHINYSMIDDHLCTLCSFPFDAVPFG